MKHGVFALGALFCLGMHACKPERPKPTLQQVVGNWMVNAATRNERPTQLLNGTYFAFDANGGVRSNLPLRETTEAWTAAFTFANDSTLRFGEPPLDYIIKHWSDSTLELEFTTRGLPFHLFMNRVETLADSTEVVF